MGYNILIVSPFVPFPPDSGGRIRIYNLIKQLGETNRLTLMCAGSPNEPTGDLGSLCEELIVVDMELARTWSEHLHHLLSPLPYSLVLKSGIFRDEFSSLLERRRFDIVQCEFLALAHYIRLVEGPKRLLIQHYMAHELRRRQQPSLRGLKGLYYGLELPKIRRYERRIVREFDHVVVSIEAHKTQIEGLAPDAEVSVVANGVDTERYTVRETEETDGLITFMGAFHLSEANVDGLDFFLSRVLGRVKELYPRARLQVIGEGLPGELRERHRAKDVEYLGYVEDERDYIAKSQLLVLPMRGGSGSKIRIPTALAMGKPVVATACGAEGFEDHTDGIILADEDREMAREIASLLKDGAKRRELGLRGRDMVQRSFSWKAIAKEMSRVYQKVLGDQGTGP